MRERDGETRAGRAAGVAAWRRGDMSLCISHISRLCGVSAHQPSQRLPLGFISGASCKIVATLRVVQLPRTLQSRSGAARVIRRKAPRGPLCTKLQTLGFSYIAYFWVHCEEATAHARTREYTVVRDGWGSGAGGGVARPTSASGAALKRTRRSARESARGPSGNCDPSVAALLRPARALAPAQSNAAKMITDGLRPRRTRVGARGAPRRWPRPAPADDPTRRHG